METELGAAVENRHSFHVNLFVDAEQSDVAWHFHPFVSDVLVASALEAAFVADRRNFTLVAASPLVVHARRTIGAASGLADIFLITAEGAQGERFSLDERQSIDLIADLRREFLEVAAVRHAVFVMKTSLAGRWILLNARQNIERWVAAAQVGLGHLRFLCKDSV